MKIITSGAGWVAPISCRAWKSFAIGTRARTLPDGLEGTCGCPALQQSARLVEAGSRVPRVQLRGVSVPQVAEEVGSDVPLREELLVTPHAVPACREERLVDFRVVEAGHRAAFEPQRACRQDEVPALERRVPDRGALDQLLFHQAPAMRHLFSRNPPRLLRAADRD